jgi:hypothetical protein
MVGHSGQEQRGNADNNRKPHCDRSALAELQHERRCDQDDREGIIDQVGVDRALSHLASKGRFRILERRAKLLKSPVSTSTRERVITSKNWFP